jgi:N-methylhydantoinase B
VLLEDGRVSIHDDRETVPPWGINGGRAGGTSSKWIVRKGRTEPERIPSKIDNLEVRKGDRILFRTAGSGGWGDPFERPGDRVAADVRHDLISPEQAREAYGVVLADDGAIDGTATEALRARLAAARGEPARFDMGNLDEVLAERRQREKADMPA